MCHTKPQNDTDHGISMEYESIKGFLFDSVLYLYSIKHI